MTYFYSFIEDITCAPKWRYICINNDDTAVQCCVYIVLRVFDSV